MGLKESQKALGWSFAVLTVLSGCKFGEGSGNNTATATSTPSPTQTLTPTLDFQATEMEELWGSINTHLFNIETLIPPYLTRKAATRFVVQTLVSEYETKQATAQVATQTPTPTISPAPTPQP